MLFDWMFWRSTSTKAKFIGITIFTCVWWEFAEGGCIADDCWGLVWWKGVCWVPLLGLLTPWSDPEPPSWRDCLCWSDSRLLLKRPFLVSPLSQTGLLLLLLLTDWLLKREGVLLARLLTIEPGGTAPGLLTLKKQFKFVFTWDSNFKNLRCASKSSAKLRKVTAGIFKVAL